MKLLVTGAAGQVGSALVARARQAGHDATGLARADLDVTDGAAVRAAVERHRPHAVVNAAAYTAVDRAEAEPDAARRVNADAAGHVAEACARAGVPLVHLSTDYVFDGTKGEAYVPGDAVAPLGVYGRTKAEGEAAVRAAGPEHVVVRTAWVFSAGPANFVRTMLRLARERDTLRVVADQWGHPTWAGDVAAACLVAAECAAEGRGAWGTFHHAGGPLATWHALASAAVERAAALDPAYRATVEPIATADYPTAAARPASVPLDMSAFARAFGVPAPDWRVALGPVVAALVAEAAGPPAGASA